MDYQSALDYILSFADYERQSRSALVFDLRRMELLLARLGNPETAAFPVHVAGTKGKGSTCAMIASILTTAGQRTGLYTSPHLFSFTERVQVDGWPITGAEFADLVGAIRPEVAAVNEAGTFGQLTTFELLTTLAFCYFQRRGVALQVLEVGLGGRLDATNVVGPGVSVITAISYDHTDVLGDTLTAIATEKAGIIKPGSIVVSSPQPAEAMAVIADVCRARRARLVKVGSEVSWTSQGSSHEGQRFRLQSISGAYDLSLPLLGEYQVENAAAAVAAVELLAVGGVRVPAEAIARGLARVHWPGRLQIIRDHPRLVVDCAHNAHSAQELVLALGRYFNFDRLIFIFGASADKDIAGMAAALAPAAGLVITTRADHPRAVGPDRLAAEFARWGAGTEAIEDTASAVARALAAAGLGDLICATGSVFVAAEVMRCLGVQTGEQT